MKWSKKINIEEHFIPRIKDIIIDSFLSQRKKINPNWRRNVFELFGFDFLMDEEFRLWLLEINTNPYLGCPNDEMKILVPAMMEDLVQIVVDPINKPSKTLKPANTENRFELIFRDENVLMEIPAVNQRRDFKLDLCYPILDLKPFIGKMHTSTNKHSVYYKEYLK